MSLSISDRIAVMRQIMPQKEVARRLGVSVRTVRRWQNENVQPRNPEQIKVLVKKSNYSRQRLTRIYGKESALPSDIRIIKDTTAISPKIAPFEIKNGNVKRFFDLAKFYRDNTPATSFRLLLKTPGGTPDYPESKFYSTSWAKLKTKNSRASDFDLYTFIESESSSALVTNIVKIFVS